MSDKRVYLYDSTLRDGAQTQGVDFNVADKVAIARELDRFGIDFIEGGWPGANPTDDAFFAQLPALSRARITAFGMTRRAGRSAANDPGLAATLGSGASAVCLVGKAWDYHVRLALGVELDENLAMIADSVAQGVARGLDVFFDAEHFFDGYKANPAYALAVAEAAYKAGARWIVLCETNGGALPHEVAAITAEVARVIPGGHLGIHCHDDTGNAVANSLAAVQAGARQVQGTLNGLGERCGNANLVTLIPTLMLKMGFETGLSAQDLSQLTHLSRFLDARLNRAPNRGAPYVGESAFAHKGGLHVSAVAKDPACYEHVDPAMVGNHRHIVVSDQSGLSNIRAQLLDVGIDLDTLSKERINALLDLVKQREFDGYTYDGAEASFELLARRALGQVPDFFRMKSFRVIVRHDWLVQDRPQVIAEATVKVDVGGREFLEVAEGNGPVNALDAALRKALQPFAAEMGALRLVDYKVRIFTPRGGGDGTDAVTRVVVESADADGNCWSTVGVSTNVVDASFEALIDSITYKLFRSRGAAGAGAA